MPHPLFERHAATLERALTAIADRGYWSAYSESPSPKVYGEGAADAGKAAFDALRARNFPESRIKVERFAASIPKHTHVVPDAPRVGHAECEATVVIDGATRTFTLEKGKENLLDAGLRNGIELPYSCKGGVCSTCRCRVVEGEVDMDVNFALEDYEVERGFILACQSYPVTDTVKVTFDDTGTG